WIYSTDAKIFETGKGIDTVYGMSTYTLGAGLENLYIYDRDVFGGSYGYGNDLDNLIVASDRGCHLGGGALGNDTLIGGAGADAATGAAGEDSLLGMGGHDRLFGDDGRDTLDGGTGADDLYGGAGDDVYIVMMGPGATVVEDFISETNGWFNEGDAGGIDTLRTDAQTVTLMERVENLDSRYQAGDVNSAGANVTGNALNNLITTAAGQDTLFGFSGQDTLVGGAGSDVFGLWAENATAHGEVRGFVSGQDRLALYFSTEGVFGTSHFLAADRFKIIGSGQALDRNDRILYDATTGALFLDEDGSGAGIAREIGVLAGHPVLSAADFMIVTGDWLG
ncbi:MAG: hypothetical protein H7317_12680, partial [Pseudorhodobacter sp.]|nr:hypothetical protein [Pseudorhodobacter sp.]